MVPTAVPPETNRPGRAFIPPHRCGAWRRAVPALLAMTLAACAAGTPAPAPAPPSAPAVSLAAPHPITPPRMPRLTALRGLKPAEIVALLGEPDFRRAEPPAELWQYRASDCVLDLYFYRGGSGFRVADAETRQRAITAPGIQSCRDQDAPFRDRLLHTRL